MSLRIDQFFDGYMGGHFANLCISGSQSMGLHSFFLVIVWTHMKAWERGLVCCSKCPTPVNFVAIITSLQGLYLLAQQIVES